MNARGSVAYTRLRSCTRFVGIRKDADKPGGGIRPERSVDCIVFEEVGMNKERTQAAVRCFLPYSGVRVVS